MNKKIIMKDTDSGRYETKKSPSGRIEFTLTDGEIRRILLDEFLIEEKALIFLPPFILFLILALCYLDLIFFIAALFFAVPTFLGAISFFGAKGAIRENYTGKLYLSMYDELLVVNLANADIELEYPTMQRKKPIFGFLRIKCNEFFTLKLPKRIEDENPEFFSKLYLAVENSKK